MNLIFYFGQHCPHTFMVKENMSTYNMVTVYLRPLVLLQKVVGGLQVTGELTNVYKHFNNVDYFISGESEIILKELIDNVVNNGDIKNVDGIIYKDNDNKVVMNDRQPIIENLDVIPHYDYSVFDNQVFLRPYNGRVVRAVVIMSCQEVVYMPVNIVLKLLFNHIMVLMR